jgi:hypothetical protein
MSIMNLANGYFGMTFGAANILFAEGLFFVGIMLLTLGLTLPRSVYVRGLPSRPLAAA